MKTIKELILDELKQKADTTSQFFRDDPESLYYEGMMDAANDTLRKVAKIFRYHQNGEGGSDEI